jgi:hypothetical protein
VIINSEIMDTEHEEYVEPASFGEHQLLIQKARKILKNARKFKTRKRKLQESTETTEKEDSKKIVLAPENPTKGIRVISLPKLLPPPVTIASVSIRPIRTSAMKPSFSGLFTTTTAKDPLNLAKYKKEDSVLKKIVQSLDDDDDLHESSNKDNSITVWNAIKEPRKEPETYPKAIIYPENKKQLPISNQSTTSFLKEFEKLTAITKKQAQKNLETRKREQFIKVPNLGIKTYSKKQQELIASAEKNQIIIKSATIDKHIFQPLPGSSVKPPSTVENQLPVISKKPIIFAALPNTVAERKSTTEARANSPTRYLIQQNLLSSPTDKALPVTATKPIPVAKKPINTKVLNKPSEYEYQFVAVRDKPQPKREPIDIITPFPQRPEVNLLLMENLAYYRVIARYLLNKKKIPPMDFDSTDNEYINCYRSLK